MKEEDRSVQGAARNNATNAGAVGSNLTSTADKIGGNIIPTLENDVNSPTGYTPQQESNMLTAAQQATGGAAGSIAGEASRTAARTNNTGSLSSVLDQAARRAAQTGSGTALDIANKSADLAQKKRAAALGQLGGLYGTDTGNALKAMGLQNEDLQTELSAGKSGFLQNDLLPTIGALSGASKGPMAYL